MILDPDSISCPILDRQAAINNLGGLVWLYEKHLSKFKTTYTDSAEIIRENLIQGKTDEARRLIHSVKGLSGTLGLRQLYYVSSLLEKAVINSDPSTYELLELYNLCLQRITDLINE